MTLVKCKLKQISITVPGQLNHRLLFQAFYCGVPIGYARLERISSLNSDSSGKVVELFNPASYPVYKLRMIEVSQNYRGYGIGTALLQEVIEFCRQHHVGKLSGKIQGEYQILKQWYLQNGFNIKTGHMIEMTPWVYGNYRAEMPASGFPHQALVTRLNPWQG